VEIRCFRIGGADQLLRCLTVVRVLKTRIVISDDSAWSLRDRHEVGSQPTRGLGKAFEAYVTKPKPVQP
jgi:hypothetical protein